MLRRHYLVTLLLLVLFLTTVSAQSKRDEALRLYRQQNFVEALPLLETLAKELPDDGVVQEAYVFSLYGATAAMADKEAARKQRAKSHALATDLKKRGITSDLLNAILEAPPDGSEARFSEDAALQAAMEEAEAHFSRGELEKAIAAYKKVLELNPKHYLAATYAGDSYFKMKKYPEAEEWFAKAVAIDPEQETAHRYWGTALLMQDKKEESFEKYVSAVLAQPYQQRPWTGLNRWAGKFGYKLRGIQIKSPNRVEDKDGKTHITLSADAFNKDKDDGSFAWMMYDMGRGMDLPSNKGKSALEREVGALEMVAKILEERKIKKNKLQPQLALLQELRSKGLVPAYVLLQAANEEIAKEYVAYRTANRDKLVQFIREYMLVKN